MPDSNLEDTGPPEKLHLSEAAPEVVDDPAEARRKKFGWMAAYMALGLAPAALYVLGGIGPAGEFGDPRSAVGSAVVFITFFASPIALFIWGFMLLTGRTLLSRILLSIAIMVPMFILNVCLGAAGCSVVSHR